MAKDTQFCKHAWSFEELGQHYAHINYIAGRTCLADALSIAFGHGLLGTNHEHAVGLNSALGLDCAMSKCKKISKTSLRSPGVVQTRLLVQDNRCSTKRAVFL